MSTEQFEKWAASQDISHGLNTTGVPRAYAAFGWTARQPEIDALIHDNARLLESLNAETKERCRLEDENAALRADPTQEAQDALTELANKQERLGKEFEDVLYSNLDALYEGSEPAQEDEPVAYQYLSYVANDKWLECDVDQIAALQKNGYEVRPLYTRPKSDQLRKAAEEAKKLLSKIDKFLIENGSGAFPYGELERGLNNLRTALAK